MSDSYTVPPCPNCGSKDISEHVNGMPDMIAISELEAQGYSFIFNGYLISGDELDYHCNECKTDYLDPTRSDEKE